MSEKIASFHKIAQKKQSNFENVAKFCESCMKLITAYWQNFLSLFYSGQGKTVHSLENSSLYTEDRLGLKEMNEQGRLVKYAVKGNHLQISREELEDIIDKYIIGNGTSIIPELRTWNGHKTDLVNKYVEQSPGDQAFSEFYMSYGDMLKEHIFGQYKIVSAKTESK